MIVVQLKKNKKFLKNFIHLLVRFINLFFTNIILLIDLFLNTFLTIYLILFFN